MLRQRRHTIGTRVDDDEHSPDVAEIRDESHGGREICPTAGGEQTHENVGEIAGSPRDGLFVVISYASACLRV